MEKPESAKFAVLDFKSWNESNGLILTPKFQRREVWKSPARSYFIDSLLRGIPIPPILLRISQSDDRTRIVREVVDGQQRLRAVLDFLDNKYALSKTVDNKLAGKRFAKFPQADQDKIHNFSFLCEIFRNISDRDVLEIFARVNTYAVGLTPQELRNGKFFGKFKQSAYSLAFDYLEFWRSNRIFSESSIARMLEVELTSELLIALIGGQQDKKKSIDSFYQDLDEVFKARKQSENRFQSTLDVISETFPDGLGETEFRRPPLFYTLFCVVAHFLFGIPNQTERRRGRRVSAATRENLRDAVVRLSDVIGSAKAGQRPKRADTGFVAACLRQTDNIRPRQVRFARLFAEAF